MNRLKTSTSLVLLLSVVPASSMADPLPSVVATPPLVESLEEDRERLRLRLDAASHDLMQTSDDARVAQWNNWSNWTNFWNNWNNWPNW